MMRHLSTLVITIILGLSPYHIALANDLDATANYISKKAKKSIMDTALPPSARTNTKGLCEAHCDLAVVGKIPTTAALENKQDVVKVFNSQTGLRIVLGSKYIKKTEEEIITHKKPKSKRRYNVRDDQSCTDAATDILLNYPKLKEHGCTKANIISLDGRLLSTIELEK